MLTDQHRHLLWDWNGTLLDDVDLCIDIVNGMLARRNLAVLDRAGYHERFDFPVRLFYERVGFDLAGDNFTALSREFIGDFDARRLEARLHDGVDEMLSALGRARDQSILSAHRQHTLHEIVGLLGIERHFTHMAGLDDAHAHGKIDRGHQLMEAIAAPRESFLLIGDTLHDLEVARSLGIDCVLIARGHHSADRLRASGARVLESLRELL